MQMAGKLPIEFIEFQETPIQDFGLDSIPNREKTILFSALKNEAENNDGFFYYLTNRIKNLEKELDDLDYKSFSFSKKLSKFSNDVPKFINVDDLDLSDLFSSIKNIRGEMSVLFSNLSDLISKIQMFITSKLSEYYENDDFYTKELERLKSFLYIQSIDTITRDTKALAQLKIADQIQNTINELYSNTYEYQNGIEDVYKRLLVNLTKLIKFYENIYAKYLELQYKISELEDGFEDALDRSENSYLRVINASYLKEGNYIRVRKQDNEIIVSAWRPVLEDCPQPQPLWYPPDIKVYVPQIPDKCFTTTPNPYGEATTSSPAGPTTTFSGNPLDIFKGDCSSCNDSNYWTKAETSDEFVKLLKSNNVPLNPADPSQYAAARDWWSSNKNIDINELTYFFYGMGGSALAAGYNPIILGSWNKNRTAYFNTINNFYKCLYEFLKVIYPGVTIAELANWNTFLSYASSNLSSLQRWQLVDIYLTYHWRTYVNILDASKFGFLINDNNTVQDLSDILKYNQHLCERFTFQEVNSSTSNMGWALTYAGGNVRVINTEPDSSTFNVQAQSPLCFQGGQFVITQIDYTKSPPAVLHGKLWNLEFPGTPDPTVNSGVNLTPKVSHNAVYTAVHESAHTVDFGKGKTLGTTTGFSTSSAWLNIAGWKLSGGTYQLDVSKLKYPSQVGPNDVEPPVTAYGHTFPWEDFAEAWAFYILNPAALQRWYPKKYNFFENQVKPFLNSIKRNVLKANPF